jgi:hypothetical protein
LEPPATCRYPSTRTTSFFAAAPGDTVEDELIYKIYLKRSGSGTVALRLTGWIEKKGKEDKPTERSEVP